MEEQQQQQGQQQHEQNRTSPNQSEKSTTTTEPVRSRWTPKPEQILILESIFNSGMVNPPKDETVRIRKLLEKFGAVGDANVFYWFQNRRSRSRRRQRQMQQQQQQQQQLQLGCYGGGAIQCDQAHVTLPAPAPAAAVSGTVGFGGGSCSSSFADSSSFSNYLSCGSSSSSSSSSSASSCGGVDGFFSVTPQMGFPEIDHTSPGSSVLYPHVAPNLNFHTGFGSNNNISGIITVFINGIATEVPRGPIEIKTLFGEDVILVHSSGVPVPTTEYGFLMQSLHHGESYFLVPKPTQG